MSVLIQEQNAVAVSSIGEIVCGLRSDLSSSYLVGILKAFVDDSGSDGDSTHYVLAGYIGTVEGWAEFDRLWLDVLNASPRIDYFKASEAESLRGQWTGVDRAIVSAKIDSLIEVIRRCTRRSVCVRVKQKDYNEIISGNIPKQWDDPYYLLFVSMVAACVNIERLEGENDPVDFVFDSDQQHQRKFELLLPPIRQMKSVDGRFVNAVRRDEKKFLPLQAADLLAWQTRRFLEPLNEPPRKHFYNARDCPPEPPHLLILSRQMLRQMADDLKSAAIRMLSEALADRANWRRE